MHGTIFAELKKFVTEKAGEKTWDAILEKAGSKRMVFLITEAYPDQELVALVGAASQVLQKPAPDILRAFGEFIVPDLAKIYRALIKPEWGLLDLLENTETVIHTTIRLKDPAAEPPRLKCSRTSPSEVAITYTSQRRLCPVAKGIIQGLADFYHDKVEIGESTCMLKGDSQCLISVRKA